MKQCGRIFTQSFAFKDDRDGVSPHDQPGYLNAAREAMQTSRYQQGLSGVIQSSPTEAREKERIHANNVEHLNFTEDKK